MENKERPILFNGAMVRAILDGSKTQTRRVCKGQRELSNNHDFQLDRCPYGKSGDRLWVRETWSKSKQPYLSGHIFYRADGETNGKQFALSYVERESKWRPSIHMPRWESRILLEVTNVRVERLQDISEEDARLEGITCGGCLNCGGNESCSCEDPKPDARDSFIWLWESINGQGSWIYNPWVWVIEFKVIENG